MFSTRLEKHDQDTDKPTRNMNKDREFNPEAYAWHKGYVAGWEAAEQRAAWNADGRTYPIPQQPPCPYPATRSGAAKAL